MTALPVPFHGMGRHGNNRYMFTVGGFFGPNGLGCLEPVHFGHLNIHQNKIEFFMGQRFDGLAAVCNDDGAMPPSIKQAANEFLVKGRVFSNKDIDPTPGGTIGLIVGRCHLFD